MGNRRQLAPAQDKKKKIEDSCHLYFRGENGWGYEFPSPQKKNPQKKVFTE